MKLLVSLLILLKLIDTFRQIIHTDRTKLKIYLSAQYRQLRNEYLKTFFNNHQVSRIFFYDATAPSGPGPPHCRGIRITLSVAPHSVGRLWISDQPHAVTSTWQHTTLTRDRRPCPRRDSKSQSQQQNDHGLRRALGASSAHHTW
jgi:hypothetical protein